MLKKKQRLTKTQFDQFFKTGKRFHTPELQLIYHKTEDFHGAVVVGKKVFKTAVRRNRLRRQLYNVLYRHQKSGHCSGVFIIIAKPPAKNLANKQVAPALLGLLAKVTL